MKRTSRKRDVAVALLVSCVALAVLAVPASAATLRIHESTRSELITLEFDSVTASCPRGEAPISGGYDVPDQISEPNAIYFPTGSFLADGGWQAASMLAAGDLGENSMSSTSYCAKLGKDVVTRGDTTSLEGETFTDLTAVCKRSEAAVSGGWAISTGPDSFGLVIGSVRAGKRSWKITGGLTGGTGTLVALADCVPNDEAPKLQARKRTTTSEPGATQAPASCERGEQVVSAGFKSESAVIPFEFRRDTKRKWTNNGVAFTGASVDETTIAYCQKLKKKRRGRR
jgi:hypothetical protein